MFVDFGICAGDGGVYTLRVGGGGDDVEFDLFEGARCIETGLGGSSTLPVCLRCSTTDEK